MNDGSGTLFQSCIYCGSEFVPKRSGHVACSKTCRIALDSRTAAERDPGFRERNARHALARAAWLKSYRTSPEGRAAVAESERRHRERYPGRREEQARRLAKRKVRRKRIAQKVAAMDGLPPLGTKRGARRSWTSGPCAWCGTVFVTWTATRNVTCSRDCSVELKKKKKREKKPDLRRLVLVLLAERDGARCGICGFGVDMGLPGTDPMGPTVDHRVPSSRGGTDEAENLQLAHRKCNMDKSDSVAA